MKDILFPSPYGEVGFDPTKEGEIQNEEILRFRPLTGKLVLILRALANEYEEKQKLVSVPLRGSWF